MKGRKIDKAFVTTILFNVIETALILLSGLALNLELKYIVSIILIFLISRGLFGKSLHFKTWYRCLIYSVLTMVSMFFILKVDLLVSILFAIFEAFIMTGRADITELYMWKNNAEPSKYQDIVEFIISNKDDSRLLEFERKLNEQSDKEYLIYEYRFKEGKTFSEISKSLNIDNPRIVEYLDKIAFAFRLYCGIKST